MRPSFHVFANRNLYAYPHGRVDVLIGTKLDDGRRSIALPIDLQMQTQDGTGMAAIVEPTLKLPEDLAQALFQALWDVGLRPAGGSSGRAETDALRGHIAFAEKVASGLLERLPNPGGPIGS